MKTAAWNYDDLWLGSAFSNRVFNTTHVTAFKRQISNSSVFVMEFWMAGAHTLRPLAEDTPVEILVS